MMLPANLGRLGADPAPVQATDPCQVNGWLWRFFHPYQCAGGGTDPIQATVPNTPPVAPSTEGAMTQTGVWTPDEAMRRTAQEVATDNAAIAAAQEARGVDNETYELQQACSSYAYTLAHPIDCYNAAYTGPLSDPNSEESRNAGFGDPCEASGYRWTHMSECGTSFNKELGLPSWGTMALIAAGVVGVVVLARNR